MQIGVVYVSSYVGFPGVEMVVKKTDGQVVGFEIAELTGTNTIITKKALDGLVNCLLGDDPADSESRSFSLANLEICLVVGPKNMYRKWSVPESVTTRRLEVPGDYEISNTSVLEALGIADE